MSDPIEATASSLQALTRQYEVVANNLANSSTAGFKRARTSFAQTLAERMMLEGPGPQPVSGGLISERSGIDFTPGTFSQTGRALDVAIEGKGFFVIETPEGPLYTRNGVFRANREGQLVDAQGRTVAGEGGPIILPPQAGESNIAVGTDGQVSVGSQQVGRLRLVQFEDLSALRSAGGACFQAAGGIEPVPAIDSKVCQGAREESNVSTVEELVSLITITRLYEANLKTIRTQDERMQSILQVAMA